MAAILEKPLLTVGDILERHAIQNKDLPAVSVEIYRRDGVVKKAPRPDHMPPGGKRGPIKGDTTRAMQRCLFAIKNCDVDFYSMITLTYPRVFPNNGKIVKKHLQALRKRLFRRYPWIKAIWWLEFQERGAPHYHILLNFDLASHADQEGLELIFRKRKKLYGRDGYWTLDELEAWLSHAWYQIVDSGDPLHLKAGCSWEMIENDEGALRYAAAHAAKRKQKMVPTNYRDVGKFWDTFGGIAVEKFGDSYMTTSEIFEIVGGQGLSSSGRLKKFLYDASGRFSYDV